ncbi:MAG: hypothetical protein AAF267_22870 [Deinococcota bacterium]
MTPNARPVDSFSFWQKLSDQHIRVAGGTALLQPHVPLLLANAVWQPEVDKLAAVRNVYEPHGIQAGVVVTDANESLEQALIQHSYSPEMQFAVSPLNSQTPSAQQRAADIARFTADDCVIEQVSWTESGRIGEVLAMGYDYLTYSTTLGILLAQALQDQPHLQAYLAFSSEAVDEPPEGAMLTHPYEGSLRALMLAGKPQAQQALTKRLQTEAAELDVVAELLEYQATPQASTTSPSVFQGASQTFTYWGQQT